MTRRKLTVDRPGASDQTMTEFDVVIASLVFCTIPDFDAALSEVARVLKPGGEFRFLEHVRGEGTVGVAHDVLAPAWHTVAGGCHLNRETDEIFRDDDRFELVDYTRLEEFTDRSYHPRNAQTPT